MKHHRSKSLSLLLSMGLALSLTACGQAEPAPETVPAPEADPPTAVEIREDPFGNFLDLSHLSPETLEKVRQPLGLSSTDQGITATLTEVLGDGYTLFVALEVTFPPELNTEDSPITDTVWTTTFTLAQGTVTDPAQAVPTPCHSPDHQAMLTAPDTMTILLTFESEVCLADQPVTLMVSNLAQTGSVHLFPWTVETWAGAMESTLLDANSQPCGTISLTPLSYRAAFDPPSDADLRDLTEKMRLLDDAGNTMDVLPSTTGDTSHLYGFFYAPADLNKAVGLEMGPYHAQFSPELREEL